MGQYDLQVDHGIGVGYRPAFREAFLSERRPRVSWIEIITENYFRFEGRETRARQALRRLRGEFPVAMHGVGLNLAGADPLNEDYLRHLAELVKLADPWLVTDHLCWTGTARDNLFDLLPFPFTREALGVVSEKVNRVQELLRRPIALENLTYYAQPAGHEIPEEEFFNELCARTGCGILLDVNNIFVNSVNHGIDPVAFLQRLDLRHVREVHLAGHERGREGLLIDTHGSPVRDEVWSLYGKLLELGGAFPTMIERDQNIPSWEEMERELDHLRELRARKGGVHAAESGFLATPLS